MTKIQQAINELLERLDSSPTVNIDKDLQGFSIINEQFNYMQMGIINDVVRKHSLFTDLSITNKRPHPAVVIKVFGLITTTKGERAKDWENSNNAIV